MISASLDLLTFLSSNFSFLFALVLYTILAIALSKSIKKNAKIYYWVFGSISMAFLIPFMLRVLFKVDLPFNLGNVPLLGLSMNELSHAGQFIHPLLVIIMFMGALSPKTPYVGRLMSIRKELSIIVGFPVLAHSIKRLLVSFPKGWEFFADNDAYMQNPRVASALGEGIMSFVFVLGAVMMALFLVLWITSFSSVQRKMGHKSWKSVQRWSYGLYAMLFIHALGLQVGGMVNDSAREAQKAKTEVVASHGQQAQQGHGQQGEQAHSHGQQPQQGAQAQQGQSQQPQQGAQAQQSHGGRKKPFSFESVEISRPTKRLFSVITLFLIYGSYLILRVRKAKRDRARRAMVK